MKSLGLWFPLLVCLVACSTYGALRARSLVMPIDEASRPVAVRAGNGTRVNVVGPGYWRDIPASAEAEWRNFTVTQRGSEYCVSSETFPEGEACDKDQDRLDLWSDPETTWELEPAETSSGCDQYHLLSLDLVLHDSPTKLIWRPGKRAVSLRLVLLRSGAGYDEFTFFRESSSQLQYDMTFRRVSDVSGATCVVASASLDVSCTCRKNQTEMDSFYVESLDDNGTKTPSYFSLDCEVDADLKSDSDMEWELPVIAVYVMVYILFLDTIFL